MRFTFYLSLTLIVFLDFVYSSASSLPLFGAKPNISEIAFKDDGKDISSPEPASDDTLHLVLTDSFLNYPFGTYENVRSFRKAHPETFIQSQKRRFSPYKENSFEKEKVYYLAAVKNSKPSSIGIYNNKNTRRCELVMSLILTDKIPLEKGILVGMKKGEFLKKFMDSASESTPTSNIIQLESQNKEINHYYKFLDNSLVEIKIFSNHFYNIR